MENEIFIYTKSSKYAQKALELSQKTSIKITEEFDESKLILKFSDDGLSLTKDKMELKADFSTMLPRLKPNNLNGELIVKAVKIKNFQGVLKVLDATAGFGEDSFLLAGAGFNVSLYEHDTVIAELLEDALFRAKNTESLKDVADRLTLFKEDSIKAMKALKTPPDVVLLDPMFPKRQKQNTLIKKKFQLLQQLESPCSNEEELLNSAMALGPKKIVIKRPAKGPNLAGIKPSYSLLGKAIRYDCIVL